MFRRPTLFVSLVMVAAGVAAACGSSSSSSLTAPTTIGTITGIVLTVNPPGVGATVSATASVSLSNGNNVAIVTGFSSDTPSVATITNAGAMTGISVGDVTIAVDYQGFKASKKVRVLPNYNGVFQGSYVIDKCTDTGDFAAQGYCATLTSFATLPLALANTQTPDLTSVTGQFALGTIIGNGSGNVSSTGALSYSGAVTSGTARIDLLNLNGAEAVAGKLTGTFEQTWSDSTLVGQMQISCTIADMPRVSGGTATAAMRSTTPVLTWAERLFAVHTAPWR